MPAWSIVLLCSIAAVALFVFGMSLTLMVKGHPLDSEISTNEEMRRRGIKCAVQETREADGTAVCAENGRASGASDSAHRSGRAAAGRDPLAGCTGNCAACDVENSQFRIHN